MIVKFVYNSQNQLDVLNHLKEKFPNLEFESFDFNIYKDKKKAYKILGACSARLIPFCSVYNENKELIKAFYSEVSECTENNISKYLKENESRGIN